MRLELWQNVPKIRDCGTRWGGPIVFAIHLILINWCVKVVHPYIYIYVSLSIHIVYMGPHSLFVFVFFPFCLFMNGEWKINMPYSTRTLKSPIGPSFILVFFHKYPIMITNIFQVGFSSTCSLRKIIISSPIARSLPQCKDD